MANWVFARLGNEDHLLTHTWSLSVEEQFYLLWPVALVAVFFRRGYRALLRVCVAGIAASALLRYLLYDGGAGLDRAYFGTDTRADALLIGCAVAVAAYAGWLPTRRVVINAVTAGAVVGCGVMAVIARELPRPRPALYQGGFSLVALCAAVIIVAVLVAPESAVARAMAWRPLQYLGRISYGVYLWHWPLHFVVVDATPGHGQLVRGLLTLSLSVVVSALSYRYVEQPFLRLKDRFKPTARVDALAFGMRRSAL